MGAALERSVIRFLYGRPLETLLATWGISLMLHAAGAQHLRRAERRRGEPGWMSGGWQLMANLQLPWNRIVIIGFALAVLAGRGVG
jgi:urea transport system permease protein